VATGQQCVVAPRKQARHDVHPETTVDRSERFRRTCELAATLLLADIEQPGPILTDELEPA
jgi:hypothetical protein